MKTRPGSPYPLGATWDGSGVNFALFSENATGVELCLFDDEGHERRVPLTERTDQVWHGYVPQARPGLRYAFRVHGPWEPAAGHRFNPAKLLIDPYARALTGTVEWSDALFGYTIGHADADLARDERDSAPGMPKGVVVDTAFTWGNDRPLRTPWNETVIYELHVKGFTARHPDVAKELRGTYGGLVAPAALDYLRGLGITAVELMPIHHYVSDKHLVDRGLRNYWGYNSLGFFAPDIRYASTRGAGDQVREFKTMVKTLHDAGIEVILNVVYNHTAEGNHLGPTLSFRGIDNEVYYRLKDDPRYYVDYTGTGNTLNTQHPVALQLVFDSLRYWATAMHVDGFRFDLAATLAREAPDVDPSGSFLDIIRQDPVLSRLKLIAEPWDLGEGGYQVGNFPPGWTEWNDRYRDAVRSYWKGDGGLVGELASRLSGSSDLFAWSGRGPTASVNFITAHDGFTLADLVSYNDKHNEANGEDNRDGHDDNRSWNCGVEGPTADPAIVALRAQQVRNFIATLIFSQGVPMLVVGDEMGRTQGGNNNAYCQDNETSWLDWTLDAPRRALLDFTTRVIALRNRHPIFRRRRFFLGRARHDADSADILWLNPDGHEMTDAEWNQSFARCFGAHLSGDGLSELDEHGRPIQGDDVMLLLNAHHDVVRFRLPQDGDGPQWLALVDTASTNGEVQSAEYASGAEYPLQGRSLALLTRARGA